MKRSFTKFLGMVLFLVFGMGKMNAQSNVMSGSSENVLGVTSTSRQVPIVLGE